MTLSAPPIFKPIPDATRINQLCSYLNQTYQVNTADIQVVKVPLRMCPLGAHSDHQLGLVTGMTINRSVLMAFAPTENNQVTVKSLEFSPKVEFTLDKIPPAYPADWGNYVRGAALALQQQTPLQQGFTGVISADMPGGGLSSSTGVTLAYLLAFQAANHLSLTSTQKIDMIQKTENDYIGLRNGILDQSVILYSKPNQLTLIDCQNLDIENIVSPLKPDQFDILVIYSGITRFLTGTSFNQRVAECREAARLLLSYEGHKHSNQPVLRQVDAAVFANSNKHLPNRLKRRATHFFGEMERVVAGKVAWQNGDLTRFGSLISASGRSSIYNYEAGSPQLITLTEILQKIPGVYGARFSGGGFGGCCIAVIDPTVRDDIIQSVHRQYTLAHPAESEHYQIHLCHSVGGPEFLEVIDG